MASQKSLLRVEKSPENPKQCQGGDSSKGKTNTILPIRVEAEVAAAAWEPGRTLPEKEKQRYNLIAQAAQDFHMGHKLVEKLFGISVRSQYRYAGQDLLLKPLHQDRLARFNRVVQHAVEVFEDPVVARQWLSKPKVALGGESPLDLLATDGGTQQVEQMLYRAEYGVFG